MESNSTLKAGKQPSLLLVAAIGLLLGGFLAISGYNLESKLVTLVVDGISFAHETRADDVSQVLAELGIPVHDPAMINPSLTTPITDGFKIEVRRPSALVDAMVPEKPEPAPVTVKYITESIKVPFQEIRRPSNKLLKGQQEVVIPGRDGELRRTRKLEYQAEELIAEHLVVEKVIAEPVDQVVLIGQKVPVRTVSTDQGTYRYREVRDMLATAYYPGPESTAPFDDGFTAIGLEAGYGIVAVDPKVIPLRSKVYIPGYGVALAGDVGAAIKGNRVDLCYETIEEALNFGRQWVKVYVLE